MRARPRRLVVALATTLAGGSGAACGDRGTTAPHADAAPRPVRRVKPPADDVRVYPPHAIRSDGVGPYLVDAPLSEALRVVPEGPRVELLEIEGALSWRVVRAEEGRLLIGADDQSRVAFVVVLAADVARTDGGLTVGATAAALIAALGPARPSTELVRPRQVLELDKLPGVYFVTEAAAEAAPESTRVTAVIVARPGLLGSAAAAPSAHAATCRGGGDLAAVPVAELGAAARPGKARAGERPGPAPRLVFGCFTGDEPEALVIGDGEAVLVAGAAGKLRRVGAFALGAGDHVAPLDVDGDGRDELVALVAMREPDRVVVQLTVTGWDAGRAVRLFTERPLALGREALARAGATPAGVELWPEARRDGDALSVGGLLGVRAPGGGWRALAPIEPVRVRLEARRAPAPVAPDAGPRLPALPGIPDAGVGAGGGAGAGRDRDAGAPARDARDAKDPKEPPR